MAADYPNIDIAPFIDHSLLLPIATPEQISQWCDEAYRYNFAAVCVNPCYVKQVAELLYKKNPQVCTVIGFPNGANTSAVKLYEAKEAVDNGATELDVVINIGWLKAGKTEEVHWEIATICEEAGQPVKVILETSLLTDTEKQIAAELAMDAGAAFLKTSTGWNGGATVADIKLLKEIAKDRVGIKASGGIRTHNDALDLIMAGATRLGTSRGVDLLRQRHNPEKEKSE
ncbi:MAG: deoxyribose-phosphate aldolase [Nostocales cyanobacterium LE14-WE4]|jgi:deoxyribose-phosphate aldolase|uniref:deoxyribose-phosphate aldolase n=1 Tax=Dolichospermum circinale TaxID=109265 RepID=UPI002330367E|nr:deoxyribose-phosphate aldolase [Dolichospermum circinale]MCE2698924.1 deoxyribose-phosphate aldolase [Anabaena sp. 49633_E8]MCE2702485.1 deoxyribose-phosphate aldolase [Anabaena sp. 49633_E8]MDB9449152.1 deoxyribose-phosphate aldolase [Dolichospermum circinale CS-547]MDJ0503102.1 deoxyribose-phosphate aldolase [Nostocales cyanobacterium LE14-WE4]